ncbi:uncharacterized protein [Coffea arabica]|uniref:MULE transposase domain-containing protein n=1 Tax=Coffea arabica TaxID=13443 RepID=A0ABM4W6P7_COFAR
MKIQEVIQHQGGDDRCHANEQEEDWNEAIEDDENLLDRGIRYDDESIPVYSYFNADEEFRKEHFELKVDHKFTSFYKFREALVEWEIREGYEHNYIKNEGSRITAKCAKGCTKVRDDPGYSIPGIVNETRRLFMLDISQKIAARTKQKALEALRGNDMEQYHRLWDYVATVKNSNPDSHISLQIDRRNVEERAIFQRIYYGLGALKNGFLKGYRPIIGLDGCFLKSPFGGQLLTALGRDANENMFPISFAVVEVENYDSWSWFLQELISQIGRGNKGVAYTFISDRQKGLVHAIEELFLESKHRFCLKHMFENFKQRFKNQDLRNMFWEVAAATSMPEHETAIANLARADP